MHTFETVLAILLGATILSALARRVNVPYPTLLAVGGALLAFFPHAPNPTIHPELILAIFVAPVLLDAAHDTSLRDLKENWRPILSLVLVAVGLTTIAVAFVARLLFPDMPWAAAIALGALLAPPDAIAAIAVLQQVQPPHRIRTVLEGEGLLNDASALLIYKLAVAAVAAGGFHVTQALPTFALVVFGSVIAGWGLSQVVGRLLRPVDDIPTAVVLQFVMTFGVWIVAERLGLSGVVTIVVFAVSRARLSAFPIAPRLRVSSFAIWDSVTFVLNVVAFTLIGLELRPVLEPLTGAERTRSLVGAFVLMAVVIVVRLLWAGFYTFAERTIALSQPGDNKPKVSRKGGLVVGWSGMRGIVTLAAALALPEHFPYRNFIQLCAFVVVLGTLILQGLTLGPLLSFLQLPKDTTVETEVHLARKAALKAAIAELDGDTSPAAIRLKTEYEEALNQARRGEDIHETPGDTLRRRVVTQARYAIENLRGDGTIGDDAYRLVEEELDWLELSVTSEESQ